MPRTVRVFGPMPKLATRAVLASATLVGGAWLAPAAADAEPGPPPTVSTTTSSAPLGPVPTDNVTTSTTQLSSTTTTSAPVPVTLEPAQVQQMSTLQRQITATGTRLDQLAETYDADTNQLSSLQQHEASTRAEIVTARRKLSGARVRLRADALIAYMGGVPLTDITTLPFSNSNAAVVTSEYQQVAIANTSAVAAAYEADVHTLADADKALLATETQIGTDLTQIDNAQQAAMAAASTQQASLAALSAGNEPPDPAYLSAQSAGRTAVVADRSASPLAHALAAAIWAAASQVGVPYVWGGETPLPSPDAGFDCSGLVQWADGQAGVTLPRTAQEQHDTVTPVPADQAQPGDLVFWNDGTTSVQHVAIYVGAGIVLQAPSTGSVVSYSDLWANGLVGFGRPKVPTS